MQISNNQIILGRQEFIKAETKFRHGNIRKLPRFNKETPATLGFILETLFDIQKEELDKKGKVSADEAELYWFLWRRIAYLMIERKEYDEAEKLLNKLLKYPEIAEFASQELEYLKRIRRMS